MVNKIIYFFLHNKLMAWVVLLIFTGWGLVSAPFDFGIPGLPRNPVAVDAIPDIGENQQIVYTDWPGRSPQDVENQITYPLTTTLLGLPGVKNIRSTSMFGFSSIYIIFEDQIDFYWSRSRILEKLNSLPSSLLPQAVQPTLGPDATGLGQIFWYTLEGRDPEGKSTGGWDAHELRSIQDFYVRYGLTSAPGVSEVASIGGFVKEYQIDVDPQALRTYNISLEEVLDAVRQSNLDIGAQTLELNLVEYYVRGLGYIKSLADLEETVVRVSNNIPIRIRDIAKVNIGPAERRGILDKSGAEAVGGVVVARFGSNPLEVIQKVKERIAEIEPGLPSKVLADGTLSQVKIVPFYDRTHLIKETLGTLYSNLSQEILTTIIVVIVLLFNLRASLVVSGLLPIAVLMTFIVMKMFGVDANIVALSGIAIAIGTMVDVGIVMSENIVRRLELYGDKEDLYTTVYEGSAEVGSAVVAAVLTTIVSFLPVFALEGAEGKLFRPLAFTKTFALGASIFLAIMVLPALAHTLFSIKVTRRFWRWLWSGLLIVAGIIALVFQQQTLGIILLIIGACAFLLNWSETRYRPEVSEKVKQGINLVYAAIVAGLITRMWMPLGVDQSMGLNFVFVGGILASILGLLYGMTVIYRPLLTFFLEYKLLFLLIPLGILSAGYFIFRGIGQEFMPALDEGSFLLMPSAMPHAGTQENLRNLRMLDMAVTAIPEVETVVGKAGRVESALDPAPLPMYENVILYKSEYKTDEDGRRLRFKVDAHGKYLRDKKGELFENRNGQYFRQWRDHIQSPDDIWDEITKVTQLPGITSAPKLQPIETRLIMLQTGMRAPMGIKVKGPNLAAIEAFGLELEKHLRQVEGVKDAAVFADRIVGKPYIELEIDRAAIARHGLSVADVQGYIEASIGGTAVTQTVEGRERYNVRVRYPRELRNDPEAAKHIFIPSKNSNNPIPLSDLVKTNYTAGAQMIKSEDGFLVGYVLFDKENDYPEIDVVNNAKVFLEEKIASGALQVPVGISYRFAGNYEQNLRATSRLRIILPLTLLIIFMIQYLEFRSLTISAMVFTGVFVAFAGGFIMLWLYGQPWFLDAKLFGENLRDLFQVHPVNLSVAVWVGFLALFGIVTDDGVLMATYLRERFDTLKPSSTQEVRAAVLEGAVRRVRPAMMITATTLLGFLPILTSTGRGSDIMAPMAIPAFGGLLIEIISIFIVPVLFCLWKEAGLRWKKEEAI
ncbi:MAG TPA: efflux RND transporter permease subunit [Haliscomenobacter sp.]|uniref:efflux RND transporter permease subunit n=1 Tax=Haliscomenobacter sp. TaxID=2717303 RepID=UPI002C968E6E|nr:efflux RND transporter permease subunit [Haliscomenobacter sp.]HOY17568.1 efflux RND transporter permease subunit [Haliscomenobacter sp.]HPH17359.1 efflux RND transporter permease subunit [Haliscomenobacter sp.]